MDNVLDTIALKVEVLDMADLPNLVVLLEAIRSDEVGKVLGIDAKVVVSDTDVARGELLRIAVASTKDMLMLVNEKEAS